MSEKLLGQLEAAQKRVEQLEQQREQLIGTQTQAAAELETIVEEESAVAAMARARVAGNKLAIVERELAQAQQTVKDLDLQILQGQIAEIEQQMALGRAGMTESLTRTLDLAETYHELSKQRSALLEKAGDERFHFFDQLGTRVYGGVGGALAALGWQTAITQNNQRLWIPPKQADPV